MHNIYDVMYVHNRTLTLFLPICFIGIFSFAGVRIDYSRTKFLCHEFHSVYDAQSIYAIEVNLKPGKYLDHLHLTLLSGDRKCQTSSM